MRLYVKRPILFLLMLILMPALFLSCAGSSEPDYDILILNGNVIDGTGNPWYRTDLAIRGDRIAAMGDLEDRRSRAERIVDAEGLFVAPGFIDSHSHASAGLTSPELSHARPLLAQGVTTVVINPDGGGSVDLQKQQEDLLEHDLGVNVAQLVPHGSIRRQVMGSENRQPTPSERAEMKELVEQGMGAGAVGLSTGLFYPPANFADTDEIIELAAVAQESGGVYQSHIRDESDYSIGVVGAVSEVIEISRATGIRGVVTHIKALGPNVWGKSHEITELIQQAREEEGLEIFADQYPYDASSTSLSAALVPSWATDGGREEFLKRMIQEELQMQISEEMEVNLARRGGADQIAMRNVSFDPSLEGKRLQEIADDLKVSPIEATLSLLTEGSPGIVSFNMNEDDIEQFMRQPWTMTASDGGLVTFGEGVPHPRSYGAFPRKLKTYAFDRQVVDPASAIRSMTSLPASVYRLPERGLLRTGHVADVVIFDEASLMDRATFTDPHQLSEGMVYVIVNGIPAVADGEFTGEMPGGIVKREGFEE